MQSLSVPDRNGESADILVGYDNAVEWLENAAYFGSTVGRYANRISGGRFTLNGIIYELSKNDCPNHLHGGVNGFNKVQWNSKITGEHSVKFTYHSPAGEEGYPGNLKVTVEYSLEKQSLSWKATATSDEATPVNLTNHAYFNLTGDPTAEVLGHSLTIHASKYLPVNEALIPTGEQAEVAGTPFDFTRPKTIGENLGLLNGNSFDHNYILSPATKLRLAARVEEKNSGRIMELFTNQPGMQFFLAATHGRKHTALCLEPQKFPDSPNQPAFPDSILQPGETYEHEILFRFPDPI